MANQGMDKLVKVMVKNSVVLVLHFNIWFSFN